jgi:putative Mg2+ transporter-C (MgtC) family protein
MIHWLDMLGRLLVALALGGVVGFDRGRHDHPAGLRTHMLVALAAACFMLVSTQFMYYQGFAWDAFRSLDPSRIASGVVMGLGFLGAGAIQRMGGGVRGLTTAASLWMVTASGLASGAGMYALAAAATLLALFVLAVLRQLESKELIGAHAQHQLRLDLDGAETDRPEIVERLRASGATLGDISVDVDVAAQRARLLIEVRLPAEARPEALAAELGELPGVRRVSLRRPKAQG